MSDANDKRLEVLRTDSLRVAAEYRAAKTPKDKATAERQLRNIMNAIDIRSRIAQTKNAVAAVDRGIDDANKDSKRKK